MIRKNRQIKLSSFVSLIISIPIAVMGIVILSTISVQLTSTVDSIESAHIKREVSFMKTTIVNFLDVRKTALDNVAHQPILVQSVLHPQENSETIKDYLDSLMILKKDYNLSLLDFQGKPIYKESSKAARDYIATDWMQQLLNGERKHYIGIVEDSQYWWLIAVPIEYNGSVEGILAAEIPIANIFDETEISNMPEGMKLDLYSQGLKVISVGEHTEGITFSDAIDEIGVRVVFTLDNRRTVSTIKTLTYSLVATIGLFTVLTIILLVYFGKRFIALPVNEIRCMAMSLAKGDRRSVRLYNYRILELQALNHQFLDMAGKIEDRESALVKANENLEEANGDLLIAMKQLEDAQVQMIQQEKLASIGHLAAGVAHELNNPIGFVSSNFTVLKDYFAEVSEYITGTESEDLPGNVQFIIEDVPELISDSQEGLDRVTSIVKNLRDFSRVDNYERSDYDLNKGVTSTLIVARNEYKYVADVETDLGDIPNIYAKGSEINDVLLNLIINATHAISSLNMDEKGLIRICTYADAEYVTVEVSDNGPGIHESVIGRIFDPFFTTKEPGKGTGLGLNIAYNTIVNKHKGILLAESTYGEGARFIMRLPIKSKEIEPEV